MSEVTEGYRPNIRAIIRGLQILLAECNIDEITLFKEGRLECAENVRLIGDQISFALEATAAALDMVESNPVQPKSEGVLTMDNIKKVLGAVFTAAEDVAETMADGEVTVLDVLNFKDSLNAVLGLLMDHEQIIAGIGPELDAIRADPAKLADLNAWAKQDFDLPQDHLEEIVEQFMDGGVKILLGLATIMDARKALKQS
jgi:hypothetical protein